VDYFALEDEYHLPVFSWDPGVHVFLCERELGLAVIMSRQLVAQLHWRVQKPSLGRKTASLILLLNLWWTMIVILRAIWLLRGDFIDSFIKYASVNLGF